MLIAAALLVALSVGVWWLQRVAFTPSNDSSVAHSILGDEEIAGALVTVLVLSGRRWARRTTPRPPWAGAGTRTITFSVASPGQRSGSGHL